MVYTRMRSNMFHQKCRNKSYFFFFPDFVISHTLIVFYVHGHIKSTKCSQLLCNVIFVYKCRFRSILLCSLYEIGFLFVKCSTISNWFQLNQIHHIISKTKHCDPMYEQKISWRFFFEANFVTNSQIISPEKTRQNSQLHSFGQFFNATEHK